MLHIVKLLDCKSLWLILYFLVVSNLAWSPQCGGFAVIEDMRKRYFVLSHRPEQQFKFFALNLHFNQRRRFVYYGVEHFRHINCLAQC